MVASQPGKAFSVPDVEADCVRLLEMGLFQTVRPSFKRPTVLDAPQFVRVLGNRLATVPPLGPVEFIVTPRTLPNPTGFSVRIDSSLSQAGLASSVPVNRVICYAIPCFLSKLGLSDHCILFATTYYLKWVLF